MSATVLSGTSARERQTRQELVGPRGVDANERLVGSCKSNAEARLPLVTKEHILDIGNHVTNQSAGDAILHLSYRGRYGVHTRIAMPRLM